MEKEDWVKFIEQFLEEKRLRVFTLKKSLIDDLKGETKSSMGDKYETSRAQIHLEIEKLDLQYHQILEQQKEWEKIPFTKNFIKVEKGAWIETSIGNFLMATGIGEILYNGEKLYVISSTSPIGEKLLGKKEGDFIDFNKNSLEIKKIV